MNPHDFREHLGRTGTFAGVAGIELADIHSGQGLLCNGTLCVELPYKKSVLCWLPMHLSEIMKHGLVQTRFVVCFSLRNGTERGLNRENKMLTSRRQVFLCALLWSSKPTGSS